MVIADKRTVQPFLAMAPCHGSSVVRLPARGEQSYGLWSVGVFLHGGKRKVSFESFKGILEIVSCTASSVSRAT